MEQHREDKMQAGNSILIKLLSTTARRGNIRRSALIPATCKTVATDKCNMKEEKALVNHYKSLGIVFAVVLTHRTDERNCGVPRSEGPSGE